MGDVQTRHLRKSMTDAERRLWSRLRGNALGFHFRRQHRIGIYVADFVCLERQLVVEADGGQHNLPGGLVRDDRRTAWLNSVGYDVLRFWNNDVLLKTDEVVETIWRELRKARYELPSAD
ncbi:MAG: endonuclease domain-containing protein [Parvibaculum sp.]|jgi:very-short-patch-repair endonuclease|uniref:endonuclease domain-containing protein n=2 Tax=Parvibaculum sp. TaxID=2024848 RepID=UPI0032F018DC